MSVFKSIKAIREAEKALGKQCNHPSIGESCRRACVIGGMTVIQDILAQYRNIPEPPTGIKGLKLGKAVGSRLGIIVSPFEDCPKGFEEIIVQTPRNKKVKLCRLGPEVRKHWAPKGKPARSGATKGALRRRRQYARGVVTRAIKKHGD